MTETTAETNPAAAAERPATATKTTGAKRSRSRPAAGGAARRSTGGSASRAKTTGRTAATTRSGRSASKSSRGAASTGGARRLTGYAERAMLIPVGAALIARDRLIDDVGGVISDYSTPAKARAQLRRFERRGKRARSELEREARRTREELERQLLLRRRELQGAVGRLESTVGLHERRASITRAVSGQVEQAPGRLQRTGRALRDGVPLAKRVQDRFAAA